MRYQFYREHKYVSSAMNDLERLIARTDFAKEQQVDNIQQELTSLIQMLADQTKYEDLTIHSLLQKKGSTVHEHIEADHQHQDEWFASLQGLLDKVIAGKRTQERLEWGYRFYLAYRKFVCDNLAHMHEEETIILPELQRLYTDEELREVEFETYRQMTPEQMAQLMELLFPHMNSSDQAAFGKIMCDCEPEKFAAAHH